VAGRCVRNVPSIEDETKKALVALKQGEPGKKLPLVAVEWPPSSVAQAVVM
jgi:hypothetical protein